MQASNSQPATSQPTTEYRVVLTFDLPTAGSVTYRPELTKALAQLRWYPYQPTAFVRDTHSLSEIWEAFDLVVRVIEALGSVSNLTLQVQQISVGPKVPKTYRKDWAKSIRATTNDPWP